MTSDRLALVLQCERIMDLRDKITDEKFAAERFDTPDDVIRLLDRAEDILTEAWQAAEKAVFRLDHPTQPKENN